MISNMKHTHHDGPPCRYILSIGIEHSARLLLKFSFLSNLISILILTLLLLLTSRSALKVRIVLYRIRAFMRVVSRLDTTIISWTIVLGSGITNTRGIRLMWIWKSYSRSDKCLLPRLELWWTKRRAKVINGMIHYLLALSIATKRTNCHTLHILLFLCLFVHVVFFFR